MAWARLSAGPGRRANERERRKSKWLTEAPASITFSANGITENELATNVTVKGQVTLPKAVRDAAGIRPGDRVNVRVRPEGGVIIEAVAALKSEQLYNGRLEEMSRRRPIRGLSTEDVMRMTRGED
jgi:antitoxin PrlF